MPRYAKIPPNPPINPHIQQPRLEVRNFVPKVSEPFFLAMPEPPMTGSAFVQLNPHEVWQSLVFRGQEVTGPWMHQFVMVWPGFCKDMEAVKSALSKYGQVPESVWLYQYYSKMARRREEKISAVADPSWESPKGHKFIPIINSRGDLDFQPCRNGYGINTAWLVKVE
ncbi:MAG: hypothetical protein AAB638_02070 [Patescibacteria group bacterium]